MKRSFLLIGLAALLAPLLARYFWFYSGIVERPEIATPDYQSFTIPRPTMQPPDAARQKVERKDGIVLIDNFHGNQFHPAEIQSLREAVEQRGGSLETLTESSWLIAKLKYANALIVVSPTMPFSGEEVWAITDFIKRGGRMAVFTDATRGLLNIDPFSGAIVNAADSEMVNPLLANFGISVNDDYLYNIMENEGNFRNVFFGKFGKDALTFGLKQVAFYGTHSVESESGQVLLSGTDQTFSSSTDMHNPSEGGAALNADGNVVAFGDFTFMASPYNTVSDNSALIANIADFLLSAELEPSLAVFPFVFSQPDLYVYAGSDTRMNAQTVAVLSGVQTFLKVVDVNMKIATKAPTKGDKLILGTFALNEDIEPFVEPFHLQIDEDSNFIKVPGFGNVSKSGNGIILFEPGADGNTIVLLTEKKADLLLFLGSVGSGNLNSCVLQSNIAVCGINPDSSDESDLEETEEPTSESTPVPEATETGETQEATPEPTATAVG